MVLAVATLAGCRQPPASSEAAWLTRLSGREQTERIATHLRGLDVAMIEIGHRYAELYWAGQDGNWPYAAYQAAKIRTTLANAVERRPRRLASARMFDGPLAAVLAASEVGDAATFAQAFPALTAACNACHAAEQFGFLTVTLPATRSTVWSLPPGAAPPAAARPGS